MSHNQGIVRPGDPQLPAGVVRLEGRLMFCSLDEPRAFEEGQKKKYGCGFLLDPAHPQFATMVAAIQDILIAATEEKYKSLDRVPENFRKPLKDPMKVVNRQTNQPYEGMVPGGKFFNATTERPPGLVRLDLSRITDPVSIKSELHSGANAVITVNAYTYGGPPTRWTPGVSLGLRSVQKTSGGAPLGGVMVDPMAEFGPGPNAQGQGVTPKTDAGQGAAAPVRSVRDLFS